MLTIAEQLLLLALHDEKGTVVFSASTALPCGTQDATPKFETRDSIRNIVLLGQQPDEREVALIGLVKACELLNEIFAKGERKVTKKRIKELTEGEEVGKAVAAVVAEMVVSYDRADL